MLDPLQNILYCLDFLKWCKKQRGTLKCEADKWLHTIGEADHYAEMYREIEEWKKKKQSS